RHSGDLIEFVEKSVDHIALCLSRFILLFMGIPQRRGGLYFVGGSIHFDPIECFVVISGVLSRLL
ncbi:hypothetical protein, partial [Raoultella sp. T31]|uniref:hypothetical protein n=1 Tax=Raoultella sp. T31 TaxID=2054594 RepID=UPI00197DF0B1